MVDEMRILQKTLGRQWLSVWSLAGNDALLDVYESAGKTMPLDLVFGSRDAAVEMSDYSSIGIAQTSANKMKGLIEKGLLDGDSVDEIARSIEQSSTFGIKRSRIIARTESTKAFNLAVV